MTQRASSFSRRDAVIDLTTRSAVLATNAADVALRVEALVRYLLRDQRVVPVLAPGPRTSSEVLRVRDATGRIVRTVDQSERRYTTVDLLATETELLHRATNRRDAGVAIVSRHIVDEVLTVNPALDADQRAMMYTLTSSGAGVDVVVGKAGTGKSTALGAYRQALNAADIPVVGVAPSATAAHQLAMSAGIPDTATVDRLLVELDHGRRTPGASKTLTLPGAYVGAHVDYGYARTVDTAQGATVDHSLFTPSTATSAERAYVALSRGRHTNRIYATSDGAWIDAIGHARSHAPVADREPGIDRSLHQAMRRRPTAHAREHAVPLELEM